jgi:nitrogen regulatory protein PII
MMKVEGIFRPERLGNVTAELEHAGFSGFTVSDVRGHGQSPEATGEYRGQSYQLHVAHKLAIEIIVEPKEVEQVVGAIVRGARTGNVGDGLVTVSELSAVYQIRTGAPAGAATNGATKQG